MLLEVAAIRGHGEGTLFRRRTGQWVSAVTMRDGRRASRTTHSRDDAKAALTELLRLRDAGAPITGRIRLGDFLERWVSDEHDWAPATRRKHETITRVHLVPAIGGVRLSELRPSDVDRALADLGRRLGPQSVSHVRGTLRRALADAVRDGLLGRNIAVLSKPPKLRHVERTILDATQARLLIESTRGTRYGPLWTLLVTTGLRISEALGLAWSDVELGSVDADRPASARLRETSELRGTVEDVQRRTRQGHRPEGSTGPSLTVRHQLAREDGEWVRRPPKTAKGRRTIPLTPLGVDALRAQRAMQREWQFGVGNYPSESRKVSNYPTSLDGLVFTTERGRPIHGENLLPKLRADLAAAGLPKVTIHDLRHSCATVLFAAGVPLPVVSRILGHSTVRITMDTYVGRIPELNREAAEKMQEALG